MESVAPSGSGWVEAFGMENFTNYLALNKGFAPTRYREVLLTPFH